MIDKLNNINRISFTASTENWKTSNITCFFPFSLLILIVDWNDGGQMCIVCFFESDFLDTRMNERVPCVSINVTLAVYLLMLMDQISLTYIYWMRRISLRKTRLFFFIEGVTIISVCIFLSWLYCEWAFCTLHHIGIGSSKQQLVSFVYVCVCVSIYFPAFPINPNGFWFSYI